MSTLANGTSVLLSGQIPEFITSNDPNFAAFLQAYYSWLEDSNTGAVLYQTKNLLNYKDIDKTTDQFIQYFINDFLPYFPPEIVADQRKLIKVAKDFYSTKGSQNSLKFLMRVLYGLDSEVFFPKENILKASDGKWQIPQALRLILSTENEDFDISLLAQRQGFGSKSNASCIIESAVDSIDPVLGIQIVEVYVSNINRPFVAEENLVVEGVYPSNNVPFIFSEKIIGSISGLFIDPKNQGLKYNAANTANGYPGDPVVFYGGLANTPQAQKAIAYVGNVTVGSISGVSVLSGGFGYQTSPNASITVIGGGGGTGANIVISSIELAAANVRTSNNSIYYIKDAKISWPAPKYDIGLINNPGNTIVTVNLNTATFVANTTQAGLYKNYVLQVIGGTGSGISPNIAYITDYNPTTRIATLADPGLGVPLDGTSDVVIYAVYDYGFANASYLIANTSGPGNTVHSVNLQTGSFSASGVNGTYNNAVIEYVDGTGVGSAALITDYNGTTKLANVIAIPGSPPIVQADGTTVLRLYYANANTTIGDALSFANVAVGSIKSFNVINGGFGYKSIPNLYIDSTYETDWSIDEYTAYQYAQTPQNYTNYLLTRQHLRDLGQIANVTILAGGQDYDPVNDQIVINTAYGQGATFSFTTDGAGKILTVSVLTPGEGYPRPISSLPLSVVSSTGTGANLIAYGYNEGDAETVSVSDIGRIIDFKLLSRGFDYQSTPNVSLRIMDVGVKTNVYANGLLNTATTTTTAVNLYSTTLTQPSLRANFYIGKTLQVIDGTGSGSLPNSATILAYNQTTGVAALSTALAVAPDTTSDVVIYNSNVDFTAIGLYEGDFVWQGPDIGNTSFIAYFDNFGSQYSGLLANSFVRFYNFSGTINLDQDLIFSNSNLQLSPTSFNVYGNAQARARAVFLNGLIKYPGYYLNTDGQPSADQYLQANTKYHNFAYVVQVEKSLNDYKNILMNILHPSGMQMLNDMVIKDTQPLPTALAANITKYNVYTSETVSANSYWANANLIGTSTTFTSNASVGDLIVIEAGTPREQTKIIKNIYSDTVLGMESNTRFLGPGYLQPISFADVNFNITNFITTSNANTVNLNTSTFVANNKVDNFYNNAILKITGGSGYVTESINLMIGAGNTTTQVNLNTATFQASTINDYYNGYFLQIVGGTGSAASPNFASIVSYSGTNYIATLNTSLGLAVDGTSNVMIYAPNTYVITEYYSANQIALLDTETSVPIDSTTIVKLTVPEISNTFSLPATANIYGIVLPYDGISFSLGVAQTSFNANVIYVSLNGRSITVDTPQNLLVSGNTPASYYIYPVITSAGYTIINN